MSVPAQPWTAHRVRALIDETRPWPRYELIDGELLVTPAPRLVHQAAVGDLFRALANFAEREHLPVSVFTSPADHDRTTKRRFFTERADVHQYWLVDLEARVIERWRHGDPRPTIHDEVIEWNPTGTRDPLAVDLPAFFRRVWRD